MLTISLPIKSAAEALQYYLDKALEAYYTEGKEGRWFGEAPKLLRLPETVDPETFNPLLRGYSPDGRQALVQNAGAPDRTMGWDLVFSSPKPGSVLWSMLPRADGEEILACHRHGWQTALKYAEEIWGVTRRGQGGKIHERAGLLFATFEEYTSRAQDMQIHTHCLLVNTCARTDSTTGALHSINFFRAKMVLGAIYLVEYASQLAKRCGLRIKPERVGFSIEGVPQEFCRRNSKRRLAIEKALAEHGLNSAVAAKIAAQETRPRKQEIPLDQLFPRWQEAGRAFGWGPEQAAKLIGVHAHRPSQTKSFAEAIGKAAEEIPKEEQTRQNLLRKGRITAIEHGATGAEFLEALGQLRLPNGQPLIWRPFKQATASTQKSSENQRDAVRQENASAASTRTAGQSPAKPQETDSNPQKTRVTRENKAGETPPKRPQAAQSAENGTRGKSAAHRIRSQAGTPQSEAPGQNASPQNEGVDPKPGGKREKSNEQRGRSAAKDKATKGQSRNQKPGRQRPHSKTEGQRASSDSQAGQTQASSDAHKTTKPKAAYRPSREQKARNRRFRRAFGEAVDRIFPERQTRPRLTRLAFALAREHGADPETRERTLQQMRPGAERSFIHIESPRVFPKAPFQANPIKWLRLPRLAVGAKPRKWGDIRWKKEFIIGELRIQKRRLFPRANRWNLLPGIEIPALRFSFKKSKSKPVKKSKEAPKQAKSKSKTQAKESSQSH